MLSRFGFLVLCGCRAVIATFVAAFVVGWPFMPLQLVFRAHETGEASPFVTWPIGVVCLLGGLAWAGYAVPRHIPPLARWVAWEEPATTATTSQDPAA